MSSNGENNKPIQNAGEPLSILLVEIRSDGSMRFETKVPMRDALKLLMNVYTEFLFREFDPKEKSSIVAPDFGTN